MASRFLRKTTFRDDLRRVVRDLWTRSRRPGVLPVVGFPRPFWVRLLTVQRGAVAVCGRYRGQWCRRGVLGRVSSAPWFVGACNRRQFVRAWVTPGRAPFVVLRPYSVRFGVVPRIPWDRAFSRSSKLGQTTTQPRSIVALGCLCGHQRFGGYNLVRLCARCWVMISTGTAIGQPHRGAHGQRAYLRSSGCCTMHCSLTTRGFVQLSWELAAGMQKGLLL